MIFARNGYFGNRSGEWASKILSKNDTTSDSEAATKGTIAFDDAVLVDRTRKGDMQAFGALVAKYQDRIFNMIFRMCGRYAEAEELAQEAFLRALERINQFRSQSRFYTWLFRIAANLTISHRRRSGRIKFQPLESSENGGSARVGVLTAAAAERRNPGPEVAAMAAETNRRVTQALEELDDEYRLVVILRDMEDMDYRQIADVVGVPVGTVKSRLHRGRCVLKEKLADLVG
jgi:RNA polymerase sigma-70 factor (ECF subfamily)